MGTGSVQQTELKLCKGSEWHYSSWSNPYEDIVDSLHQNWVANAAQAQYRNFKAAGVGRHNALTTYDLGVI
jgi:hypothetical protein